jgi:streptogramin lyase
MAWWRVVALCLGPVVPLACSQPRAGAEHTVDAAPEVAGPPTVDADAGSSTNTAPRDGPVIDVGAPSDGQVIDASGRAEAGESSDGAEAGAPFVAFPVPSPITFRDKITTGWDGNVWFTFESLGRIGRIDRAGVVTEVLLSNGPAAADDLVSGPDSAIWFGRPHGTLGRIDKDGTVAVFTTGSRGSTADSTRVIVGPDHNIWFLTVSGLYVMSTNPQNRGQVLRMMPMVGGRAMVLGADGRVWVFSRTPEVVVLEGDGGVVATHALPDTVYTSVVVGPDKRFWYAAESSLIRLSQQGVVSRLELPRFSEAIDTVVASDGLLWFTEPRFHRIGRLDAGENITYVQFDTPNQPTRMTVGPEGALWFLDDGAGTINRLRR